MLTTTVCAALSAAGLAVAFLTAFRRRFVAATRIAAVSLLPVGLAMAGLVELAGDIGVAVGRWASHLVLRPTVWAGMAVLALAVVLFVVARVAGGRATASGSRSTRGGSAAQPGAGSSANTPELSGSSRSPAVSGQSAGAGGDAEDFSDIEAILKKHGI